MEVLSAALHLDCPVLDGDHEVLFALIDQLEDVVREEESRQAVSDLVIQLAAYFDAHFENEEQLLVLSDFQPREPHIQEHATMRRQFAQLVKQFEGGDQAVASGMLRMLRAWLRSHIEITDRALATHLIRNGMQGDANARMRVLRPARSR